jgi:ribosomal protein S18 acetylase RimI-like enzyme
VRGRGIADKLLDAQEVHARKEGLEWIYLDSYDDLKTAIALYETRGYERCQRYNDNPQATVFMRKKIVGSNRRPQRLNTIKGADPGRDE